MAQESSLCPEPRRNGLAVRIGNLVQLSQGEGGLLCRAVSCFEVKIYMRSLVGLGPGDGGTPSAGLPDLLDRALSRPWLSGVKSPPLFARLPLGTARQRGPAARCTPHLHIQVSSGIQQHLNHCLVPTDAGVHQGGHALR